MFIVVCPNTVVSQARLRLDRRRAGRRGRRGRRPQARPARAAVERRRRQAARAAAHDPHRLGAARVRRGDEGRLQEGRGRGDRGLQARSTASATPAPTSRRSTTSELLREVMNTVGKRGRLGEQVRCVVSVSMLTEGWDANTVTHILGVRAFGSQLLCEQVVGRGLRRRSYAVNEQGMFEPEYANVYGIPFQFISSDKPLKDPLPPKPVHRGPCCRGPRGPADRVPQARRLPRRASRRRDLARPRRRARVRDRPEHGAALGRDGRRRRRARARGGRPDAVPPSGGRVRSRQAHPRRQLQHRRRQATLALPAAGRDVPRRGSSRGSSIAGGYSLGYLMTITEAQVLAAEAVWNAIVRQDGNRRERLRPMINRFDPRRLDRRRRLPDPQAHRADGEVRGLPRHPRRQGRQHVGAAPRERARAEQEREVVREERPPRLHDPLRAQGPEPQLHPGLPRPARARRRRDRAHPRSSRSPAARRAPGRPARRRPPHATPGASRSTTTAASAAGATSR